MKRKTETNKWNDKWYLGLTPLAKLLLVYLYDNCDEAGFIDPILLKWETEISEKREKIIKALIELQPALVSNKKKLFIKDFLQHQEKLPLNPEKKQDRWIISKLESNLPKFPEPLNASISDILNNKIMKEPIVAVDLQKKSKKTPVVRKIFQAPNLMEFTDYYLSLVPDKKKSDIEMLFDHYVSCGWTVGKDKPMKDWQASIRTAIRRDEKWQEGKVSIQDNRKKEGESKISKVREANMELGDIDYESLGQK